MNKGTSAMKHGGMACRSEKEMAARQEKEGWK
jgi:hypothetical protein